MPFTYSFAARSSSDSSSSTLRLVVYSSCASGLPAANAVFIMPISATGFGVISTSVVWPALNAASVASWKYTGWRVMRRKYSSSWTIWPGWYTSPRSTEENSGTRNGRAFRPAISPARSPMIGSRALVWPAPRTLSLRANFSSASSAATT